MLFADYYKPFPAALGVMFDRGFDPGDDPSSAKVFRQSPREGCAVFLRAITELRSSPAQAEDEALFTTIHELGHIFNLQHVNHPTNFLSQSVGTAPYPPNAYYFLSGHRHMLAQCSTSPHVWPGGAQFADIGDFGHFNAPVRRSSPRPAFGLELAISMGQREFWRFEPVELDIEVRCARGVDRAFRILDAVDPGYETFHIWIEEPTGERRRHRSPRRYCRVRRSRMIRPGQPFRRDLSIFGEAGGYTFRVPGIHRLWAEFMVKPGLKIRSNDLEVNVKPATDNDAYYQARRVLGASPRAGILYHRLIRTNLRHLTVLEGLCQAQSDLPSVGSIRYAVARAMNERSNGNDGTLPESAAELLRRAADSPALGDRQREITSSLLARAKPARRRLARIN